MTREGLPLKSFTINKSQANTDARDSRHARAVNATARTFLRFLWVWVSGAGPIHYVSNRLDRFFKLDRGNRQVAALSTRLSTIAILFLLFSSLVPHDAVIAQYTLLDETSLPGSHAGGYTALDVMTEDGFLLKPAIGSSESDRSGFGEIFLYTVKPGDTLSSIAARFRLKSETIMWENDLYNAHRLRSGAQLKILPVDGVSHKVAKGDTMDKLAKKYKVDAEKIVKQNQMEEGGLIADATIIIPGAKKEIPRYIASRAYTTAGAPSAPGPGYSGAGSNSLIWPTSGKITQGFHRGHYALDIGNRAQGPIFAAAPGTVVKAGTGWNGGYGTMIIIDHGNGMETLYAHMAKLYVSPGQYVSQGDTIGWMGNTGRVYGVTGIHLHFEVRVNGVKYNPMVYF